MREQKKFAEDADWGGKVEIKTRCVKKDFVFQEFLQSGIKKIHPIILGG